MMERGGGEGQALSTELFAQLPHLVGLPECDTLMEVGSNLNSPDSIKGHL